MAYGSLINKSSDLAVIHGGPSLLLTKYIRVSQIRRHLLDLAYYLIHCFLKLSVSGFYKVISYMRDATVSYLRDSYFLPDSKIINLRNF